MNLLKDRVALVSGAGAAGSGWSNGRAAAVAYAREGAKLVLCDLDEAALAPTLAAVREAGADGVVVVGDMSQAADVQRAVDAARQAYGRIDILHNNIGRMVPGTVCEVSEDDWDGAMRTNLKSMFLTCRAVVPLMAAQGGGVITNIGSVAAHREYGGAKIAYTTSKAAVAAFTKAIAVHHAAQRIRANVLTPGLMYTPTFEASVGTAYRSHASVDELRAARGGVVPLGRMGDAWDVAGAAVFLASDAAAYITGTELVVDGGFTCIAP